MSDAAVPTFDQSRFVDFLTVMRRASKAGLTDVHDPRTPFEDILPNINILIVGAGGIGCELLHSLAISPLVYCNYYLIDADIIHLSNLNRQFLFKEEHIGQAKATVAANEIKKRYPQMRIEPIYDRVENRSADFYRSFHFILLGLDSVHARQWINSTVCTLYAEQLAKVGGDTTQAFPIPMIDGDTEAYKGSVRRIEIGKTPCIECMTYQFSRSRFDLSDKLIKVPRSATHCVLYAFEWLFQMTMPFKGPDGKGLNKPDGDNEDHIKWIMEKSIERQKQFKIEGTIDFQFTQGIVKNIVPAVGFSNALVAATIVNETLKMFTGIAVSANSLVMYDGSSVMGVGSMTPVNFVDPDCIECSPRPSIQVSSAAPFASVRQLAWDALCKSSGAEFVGTPIPKRAKVVAWVNFMPNVIFPEEHLICVNSAKAENNVTVADAVLYTRDGRKITVVPGETVLSVEFTIMPYRYDGSVDDVDDVCGKPRGMVMVVIN